MQSKKKPNTIKKKRYSIRIGGVLHRERFAYEREAREWQKRLRREYEQKVSGTKTDFQPMLLEIAAAKFMQGRLHHETYQHDSTRFAKYILPKFGRHLVHEITVDDWRTLFGDGKKKLPGSLVKTHELSPSTSNLVRTLVRRFYEEAIHDFKCATMNPINGIKPLEKKKNTIVFLESIEAMQLYLETAESDPLYPSFAIFTKISLNTGLREGNVMGLKFEDFDLANNILTVRRKFSHSKNTFVPGLKATSESHDVGINPILREAIIDWQSKTPHNKPSDYVVHNKRGEPLTDKTIWCAHRRTLKRAGLPYLKPHALRHSYSTHYLEAGGTLHSLKEILNHSSITVTEKYIRVMKSKKVEKSEVLQIGVRKSAPVIPLSQEAAEK